jgi:hypothetical protein
VADLHTYFVGGLGWGFSVWAHNLDCGEAHFLDAMLNEGFHHETAKGAWRDYKIGTASPDWERFKDKFLLKKRPGGIDGRRGNRPYEVTNDQADKLVAELKLIETQPAAGSTSSVSKLDRWKQHQNDALKALQETNPTAKVVDQVTIDVTNPLTKETVEIRIDAVVLNGKRGVLVDAKHSIYRDYRTAPLAGSLQPNQKTVAAWFSDPKVRSQLEFVPRGPNAGKLGLLRGEKLKVTGIEILVENPAAAKELPPSLRLQRRVLTGTGSSNEPVFGASKPLK